MPPPLFMDNYDYDYLDFYDLYDNDSMSTVFSYSASDLLSSNSSPSSVEEYTPENSPPASVVIVNSGTGGIHLRNRSDDDDASISSTSSSNIETISSTSSTSVVSENTPSLNTPSQEIDSGDRYYLRNRSRRQEDSPRSNDNMSYVSDRINDESSMDNEMGSANEMADSDIEHHSVSENEAEDDVVVVVTPPPRQQLSPPSNSAHNSPEPGNPSSDIPHTPTSVVQLPRLPVRTSEKRKCSSPVSKKARLDDSLDSDTGVDAGCNICYDSYTAVGAHRPVCLKCGHIFGFSCVERWLKVSCASGNKRCPTCNKKAHIKDIRYLYCCNLKAVDNTRVHQLSTELEQEKIQNSKYKVEITSFKIKLETLEQEINRYKALEKAGALVQSKDSNRGGELKGPVFFTCISLCQGNAGTLGMARSLIYDEYKKLLLATHQNDTRIFNGFGYSLFSLVNVVRGPPAHKFCLVSQKAIRDAAFHPHDSDLILIVSLDKTAKLIDVRTGTRIQVYNTDYPLWSCAWDMSNPNLFLVGGVNGQLVQFDKRCSSHEGQQRSIATGGTNVGIVSIIGIKPGPGRGLPRGGFLVCKLNAVLALEIVGNSSSSEDVIKLLDTSGPFMSMSYLASKNQVLLSSRPAMHFSNIRHRVFSLDHSPDGSPVLSLIQTIHGGSLAPSLSRSYIWPEQVQGHSLVYAYDASSKSLCGWSVSDTVKKVSLPCTEPLLDICRVEAEGEPMLAALSDSALHLFKHP